MYESFFALREKPFSLLPDPGFLFMSHQHQKALTLLEYGLFNQAGFIVLTGDIGSGKTTLMRHLLERLDSSFTVGLISNTHETFGELMDWVSMAFEIRHEPASKLEKYRAFADFLVETYGRGQRVLLIVDEAQNLGIEKLEELRLLSNINAGKDLVLQIMLLGQPQLRELLRDPALEQLAQRVTASYHIGPLDAAETESYIRHRVFVAGGTHDIFTHDACVAIHHYSKGVPRRINLICDTALVYAFGADEQVLDAAFIRDFIASHAPHLMISIDLDRAAAAPSEDSKNGIEPPPMDGDLASDAPEEEQENHTQPIATSPRLEPSMLAPEKIETELPARPLERPEAVASSLPINPSAPRITATEPLHKPRISADPRRASAGEGPNLQRHYSNAPASRLSVKASIQGTSADESRIASRDAWALKESAPTEAPIVRDQVSRRGTPGPEHTGAVTPRRGPGTAVALIMLLVLAIATFALADSESARTLRAQVAAIFQSTIGQPEEPTAVAPDTQTIVDDSRGDDVSADAVSAAPATEKTEEPQKTDPGEHLGSAPNVEHPPARPYGSIPGPDDERLPLTVLPNATSPEPGAALEPLSNPNAATDLGLQRSASSDIIAPLTDSLSPTNTQQTSEVEPAAEDAGARSDAPDALDDLAAELRNLPHDVQRLSPDEVSLDMGPSVQFQDGSAVLDSQAKETLARLAEVLMPLDDINIRIIAHTDSTGADSVNQWLSARRAGNVAAYLEGLEIPPERLAHEGRGKSELRVSSNEERLIGPWVNRRIEILLSSPRQR
ncbi:AAA family ATPase [Thiocapsa marina]|uniref:OmpA/MotB domain protein n=1 Tax=Thiocapsa marina 5811 TaxID=768671 RepID=F9UII8_9GAMM|nr:AAA family ATPase [Thiocapsa marina]EGV15970.1 OmpA/MotB domain protein [Thiocapsa marina 5811]